MVASRRALLAAFAGLGVGLGVACASPAAAQSSDLAKAFAPTGTLRVGVLTVTYFAIPDHASGGLIYPLNGTDGGASNVTVLTDGGLDAQGHTPDAGAARDAGADSPPADAK